MQHLVGELDEDEQEQVPVDEKLKERFNEWGSN